MLILKGVATYNVCARNMLVRKYVDTTIVCLLCMSDVEHLLHIFFNC